MGFNDSVPRKLNYPLNRSLSPSLVGGDLDSPSSMTIVWNLEDNDERQTITLTLSLNELIALASTIDVGRDIAYGEQSLEIWQIWVRSLGMELCQQIADCLNDPESPAYQAMHDKIAKQMLQGANSDPSTPTYTGADSETGKEADATLTHDECDSDIMFGFATQLVDLMHSTIEDAFEIAEAGSNIVERSAILVQEIPMLAEAVASIDQIAEEVVENYSAYYTEELRDKFRCDLFCMIVENENCLFSFSQLAQYFIGLAGGTVANVAFNVALETLTEGIAGGASTVYFAHALLCSALQYASGFMGLNVPQLQRVVQSYLNDPDSDWITLCEDCADGYQMIYEWESVGDYDYNAVDNRASFASGYGWTVGIDPYDDYMEFEKDLGFEVALRGIDCNFQSYGDSLGRGAFEVYLDNVLLTSMPLTGDLSEDGQLFLTWDGAEKTGSVLKFKATLNQIDGGWRLTGTTIRGIGTPPN